MNSRFFFIFFILGSIIITISFFLIPGNSANKKVQYNQKTKKTTESFTLPINVEYPSIAIATVNYGFTGTIKEIKIVPKGLQIITDISVPNQPQFIVCITCQQQTQIFGTFSNGLRQVNNQMLAKNQKIIIFANYNLKTSEWQTTRVNILDALNLPLNHPQTIINQPSATTSAR